MNLISKYDTPGRVMFIVNIAVTQKWNAKQIKAAAKAAKAGRSIGWQIAVARRAGYGF